MQSLEALDDIFGTITELAGALAPTETRMTTRAYTIQTSDRPGPLENSIIVIGTDIVDEPHVAYASASVSVHA